MDLCRSLWKSTCNKPCLWVHTFFELNMLHTNQIMKRKRRNAGKIIARTSCTHLYVHSVAPWIDSTTTKKEWKKSNIILKSSSAGMLLLFKYVLGCVFQFIRFILNGWSMGRPAGCVCVCDSQTIREILRRISYILSFSHLFILNRFNCRSALALLRTAPKSGIVIILWSL